MSDYFDRVERQIVRNVEAGLPRSSRLRALPGYMASAAAMLVVLVVAGVFLLAHGSSPAPVPTAAQGVTITFTASAADPHAPLGPALDRSVVILRERLGSAVPGTRVERAGNEIVVDAPTAGAGERAGSSPSPSPATSRSTTGRPMRSRRTERPSRPSSSPGIRRRSRSARDQAQARPAIPARGECRVARRSRSPRDASGASSSRP